MIQGVCFDMDGLLVDTERRGIPTLQAAARLQGCTLSDEQMRTMVGVNMIATRANLLRWFPGKIDPAQWEADWCRLMLASIRAEGLPLKPHADEALAHLRARGFRLALCTSNAPHVVAEYLQIAGWESAFDQVITGDMVQNSKPSPDIYLLGARRLGLEPSQCCGVEDSYNGIRAVRAAGMVSVMIPDLLPYTDDCAPFVDHLLSDLAQLETLLSAKE